MQRLNLVARGAPGAPTVSGEIGLSVAGEPLALEVTAPAGPTTLSALAPILQALTNEVVARGVAAAGAEGRSVSCRAGCGACCRQLVPIAEPEARRLAALVDALPEPRRTAVRARFDAALEALARAGVLSALAEARAGDRPLRDAGLAYFRAGVACPFLEAESCSIHPERPLSCREYLVTTPAERCAAPSAEAVAVVPLPGRPSAALQAAGRAHAPAGWLPLVAALNWAETAPPEPQGPAPDLLAAVLTRLTAP